MEPDEVEAYLAKRLEESLKRSTGSFFGGLEIEYFENIPLRKKWKRYSRRRKKRGMLW